MFPPNFLLEIYWRKTTITNEKTCDGLRFCSVRNKLGRHWTIIKAISYSDMCDSAVFRNRTNYDTVAPLRYRIHTSSNLTWADPYKHKRKGERWHEVCRQGR